MYIRSSPYGPSRDLNQTLSNKLLLLLYIEAYAFNNVFFLIKIIIRPKTPKE